MRLLIEDYPYKAESVEHILQGIEALHSKDGFVRVSYVGYYYNNHIKDCVFFLPKVVINEANPAKVLGKYIPEDIINVAQSRMEKNDKDFIYGLSAWVYRAVKEFQRLNDETEIVYENTFSRMDGSNTRVSNTLIDIILSLIDFNRREKDFFLFYVKNIHRGYNRINWSKTIRQGDIFMQEGTPVYMNLVNRHKDVNYDEELIVIFYSILNYIRQKYGFHTEVNLNYELITGSQFQRYLQHYGKQRLRQIKYRYFSDKEVMMWKLCYAFFELSEIITSTRQECDYLLVKNFNVVFEAMIDELLSEKELKNSELADQPDGKIVDHIFPYEGVMNNGDQIYYIGDSKYYKIENTPGKRSVYKQYTYARNVIQYNMGLFLDHPERAGQDYLIYRDEVTEGYNITPNFFISGLLSKDLSYKEAELEYRRDEEPMLHFKNRLFDRDTLLLQHYDVNFLFILALYGSGNSGAKEAFREEARERFRKHFISYLEKRYQFFSLQHKPGRAKSMNDAIDRHFREIIGKTFRPYNDKDILYLSCECKEEYIEENHNLIASLSEDFLIREYKLGTDPRQHIEHYTETIISVLPDAPELRHLTYADMAEEVFLFGGYRSDKPHKAWIDEHKLYNVRYNSARSGSVGRIKDNAVAARFLVLYEIGADSHPEPHVYLIDAHERYSQLVMTRMGYPDPKGSYLVYRIFAEVKFDGIDVEAVLNKARLAEKERLCLNGNLSEDWEARWIGTPIYFKGKDLI